MDILAKLKDVSIAKPKIYTKLDESRDQIRITTILPGRASDPVQCTVEVVNEIHSLSYETLSYVWGDQTSLREIRLNGQKFSVTRNLYLALHRLRKPAQPRMIWIDALCIDQGNSAERGSQVRLMRRIYHLCGEVLVFLEEATDDTNFDDAEELNYPALQEGGLTSQKWDQRASQREWNERFPLWDGREQFRAGDTKTKGDHVPPSVRSPTKNESKLDPDAKMLDFLYELANCSPDTVTALPIFQTAQTLSMQAQPLPDELRRMEFWFNSEWFNRVWVVQEVTLPEKATLVCGSCLIPWDIVVAAAMNIYDSSLSHEPTSVRKLNEPIPSILTNMFNKVLELESTKAVRTHGRDMGIPELLWLYRHRRASDDRDHIYGLSGLLPGQFVLAGVTPNYGISADKVYQQTTGNLIRVHRNLRVIIGSWIKEPGNNSLPSWVPDWGYTWRNKPHHPLIQFYALQCGFAAASSTGTTGDQKFMSTLELTDTTLRLSGAKLDKISHIGKAVLPEDQHSFEAFTEILRDWLKLLQSIHGKWSDEDEEAKFKRSFWQAIHLGAQTSAGQRILRLKGPPVFERIKDPRDENNRFLAMDSRHRVSSTEEMKVYLDNNKHLERARAFGLDAKLREMKPADFELAQTLTLGRRIFYTEAGRVGLAPYTARVGDEAFALWGGEVPFVLRKLVYSGTQIRECSRWSEDHCYSIIGECYLDGAMMGNARWIPWGPDHVLHIH